MSEIREALTAAGASAVTAKRISPRLLELTRRYSPLVRMVPTEKWDTPTYFFPSRSSLPVGGFVTDGGAVPVSNSVYAQGSFNIKLLQIIGSVTGFAQAVSSGVIGSLLAREQEGARQGQIWDTENAMLWGNSVATANGQAPQFDGLDNLVSVFSGVTQNAQNLAGATLALRHLDLLIDSVEENAATSVAGGADWMFVTSPAFESKISQLLVAQQRFTSTEAAPGLNVSTYRGIPIVKSSFLAARSVAMGAVTTATAGTGGTLAAGTYQYVVSAFISRYGEILGSPEVSQTTSGATSTVTLTITPPTGMPDGGGPTHYAVYRTAVGGASGSETLLGYVDAKDTGGTATTTIVDTGTNLLTNASNVTGPAAYVNGGNGKPYLRSGEENIYLIPNNPDFLVRPYVRNLENIPLFPGTTGPDQLPFAIVSDTTLAVRGPKYVARATRIAIAL